MRKALACHLCLLITLGTAAQTRPQQQTAPPPGSDDEVLRITTSLIQVDAVVVDKNDQTINDLKLSDFDVYENGKKQDLQFVEFVGGSAEPRVEHSINVAGQPVQPDVVRNLSSRDLRRVLAFVVDDLTIPFDDLTNVRTMLRDFVDNQMREGDLVAIVRVVGGRGILQQFTSDKQLLRRAIAEITPQLNPYSAFGNLATPERLNTRPLAAAGGEEGGGATLPAPGSGMDFDTSPDGVTKGFRALTTLSAAGDVMNSMRTLPGRKNLLLISGGLPIFESTPNQTLVNGAPIPVQESRALSNNVSYMLRQLTDRAGRAGVVINTMDIRGLNASRGVARYTDPGNEGRSGLMPNRGDATFGRTADLAEFDNLSLDTMTGHLGLQALASATGGVSVVNSSDFRAGLDRVLARSSYYLLAYKPSEPFDNKFHKVQIKVNRPGAKVYARQGYVATADAPARALTKEETIIRAAMSPLAKRDVDIRSTLQFRFTPDNRAAAIDVNLVIDANKLDFKQGADGKYQAKFDVVGFLVNALGKTQGGFSQTVSTSLAPEEYKRALDAGINFTGHAELSPGTYQLRAVVRDDSTGQLGSMSQFIEVPDLSRKRLTVSSLFLYAVDLAQGNKATPEPLDGLRRLPRQKDLRFAAIIYNPKQDGGKTQVRTQTIISRADKVVFRGAEQPLGGGVQNGQLAKIDQFGVSKLQPGRYVLTLVVTDPLADKDNRTVVRSMDFTLVD
ncbi:MAG TPA: VWA domain-containing protein [Pyrinomonadaceae bacterium]|jgi:VWFA-related protein|nr:VWA domain-containing protein [Pyrinomonadaceae bacterium]